MKPRKPILDRLYFNSYDNDKVLDFERSYNARTTPEQRALNHALKSNSRAVFDAGTLPEVIIRPPKDNAVYKTGYMIPNKSLRNSFYESIDDDVDQRMYINRLWKLYNKSQKPSIKNVLNHKLDIVPIYQKIRGKDTDRPHYTSYTNTMYVSPDYAADDIEAELAHAYQFYGTDMPRKYGWPRAIMSLPGDIKIGGKRGYERVGNIEFDAHKIIEPMFHDYLTIPDINYEDTHDVMMDMYENPDFYFKPMDKGPFSGSTKRIKPLSK